jgi:hypothetical protein
MNNIRIKRPEERGHNINNTGPDLNQDGFVTPLEERLYEKKAINRRKMAWVSLIAMIASGIAVMFFIPEERLLVVKDMLDWYWIGLSSIVGAYVGISTWMTKR